MSSSSRLYGESDSSKVDLPVFVSPNELLFAINKRRSLLTVFNPYSSEAQFRIMTTNPDRFDVSVTKGTIKPSRRIDITIRLLSQKIEELPEPNEEPQTIDFFRISLQVGQLKGNKPIKVNWCLSAELLDTEESHVHLINEDKASKLKLKSLKTPSASQSIRLGDDSIASSHSQRPFHNRKARQVDNGSNVNLVCTICSIVCVISLFLPLSIDSELCKKAKSYQDQSSTGSSSLLSQLTPFLSVSYEMKLGCSFALGLFTYRLISTLPD